MFFISELSLMYLRWSLPSGYATELILEMAYWIGPVSMERLIAVVLDRYRDDTHTEEEDQFVVFHLHIPLDDTTFYMDVRHTALARFERHECVSQPDLEH